MIKPGYNVRGPRVHREINYERRGKRQLGVKTGQSEAGGKAERQLEAQLSCKLLLFLGFSPGQGFLHPCHHVYLALLVLD